MTNKTISRRQALKTLLAAAGGIGASAFLPSRWVKPIVQSGVLPAHAQSSASYNLFAVSFDEIYAFTGEGPSASTGTKHLASPARILGGTPYVGAVITLVNWTLYHANAGSGWDEGSFVTTDVNGMADFELGDPTSTGNDSTAVLHYRAENGKTIDEECSSFIY